MYLSNAVNPPCWALWFLFQVAVSDDRSLSDSIARLSCSGDVLLQGTNRSSCIFMPRQTLYHLLWGARRRKKRTPWLWSLVLFFHRGTWDVQITSSFSRSGPCVRLSVLPLAFGSFPYLVNVCLSLIAVFQCSCEHHILQFPSGSSCLLSLAFCFLSLILISSCAVWSGLWTWPGTHPDHWSLPAFLCTESFFLQIKSIN